MSRPARDRQRAIYFGMQNIHDVMERARYVDRQLGRVTAAFLLSRRAKRQMEKKTVAACLAGPAISR